MTFKRSLIHPSAAEGQACEEAILAMNMWDILQTVFMQATELSSIINNAVLLSLLAEDLQVLAHDLGNLHKSQQFYQL